MAIIGISTAHIGGRSMRMHLLSLELLVLILQLTIHEGVEKVGAELRRAMRIAVEPHVQLQDLCSVQISASK